VSQAQTCEDQSLRVSECEELLKIADSVIDQQAKTIDQLATQNQRLEKELSLTMIELAKEKAWYKDPTIIAPLMFTIGLVTGAYTMRQLQ
jgi:hypothetical protein